MHKRVLTLLLLSSSLGVIGAMGANAPASISRRAAAVTRTDPQANATQRYRLDSSQSKFIAHGLRGGLLWFKGHEHLVAAREFSGEAQITPDKITPASLPLHVLDGL